MSRLKTSSSKSAKTSSGYDKTKRRKKKSTPRRSASAGAASSPPPSISSSTTSSNGSSSGLTITAPTTSMRNSVSSMSSPSNGTPTSSKDCEQCGNPAALEVGNNAKAVANSKKVSATANSGCQVCDFVTYRKAQRHCIQCDRTQCDVFCEWCGHGFHTKCAKARGEQIDAVNGFCCKKCEAEQADDDDDEEAAEANDVNAKCGECQLPFNSTADAAATSHSSSSRGKKDAANDVDSTGFKVNQSVLVENDEVLYNAVITDVDAKNERVKIHFLRWSKSFDNWYTMDDERINESLACDCCNRWFHIGCLPPIKSSGRFKDTTYVCPTCLEDAKGFFAGTRTTVTSLKSSKSTSSGSSGAVSNVGSTTTSGSSSRRKGSQEDDTPAVPASSSSSSSTKKRSSKHVVQSDSEEELLIEPERLNSKASSAASKKSNDKEKENIKEPANESKSRKRRRSNSADSVQSNGSDKKAKGALPVTRSDSLDRKSKSKRRERSKSHEDGDDDETKAQSSEKPDERMEEESKAPTPETTDATIATATSIEAKPPPNGDASKSAATSSEHVAPTQTNEILSMDKPTIKRKISGHSVSSLLNSPSSPPRNSPALRPQTAPTNAASAASSSSAGGPSSSSSTSAAGTRVKVEKDPLALPAPPAKKATGARAKVWVTGRDAKTAKAAAAVSSSSSSSSSSAGRNALSAFDILREVAAQSMSDEIDAPAPAAAAVSLPPTTAAARRTQKARATAQSKGAVKNEADKPNGRTPLPSSSSSSAGSGAIGVGIPMNSYVDLHFAIRKEMYLRICMLEDERLLERETAQLLRAMIYPTSDKFHDLKFVYVVNKDLSSLQLTKRLLELVPITSGGTAPVIPMRPALGVMGQLPHPHPHPPPSLVAGSCNSSAAPSPARPSNASPAPPGYHTPVRSASPAVDAKSNAQPEPEPQPTPLHKVFQLPSSIGFASAVDRLRPGPGPGPSSSSSSSSILTSTISPSSTIGPQMPPPLSTKLLLETMHKHSKFPTLLPPPPPAPLASSTLVAPPASASTAASSTATSLAASASSSSSSSAVTTSTTTTTTSAAATSSSSAASVVLPKPSPERPVSLVNNISASISSN